MSREMMHVHRSTLLLLALALPAPAAAQDLGFALAAKGTTFAEASAYGSKRVDEGQENVEVRVEGKERAQCATPPLPSRAGAAALARSLEELPAGVRYRLEAKAWANAGTIFSCGISVVGKQTQAAARSRATLGVHIQLVRAGAYELSIESAGLPAADLRVSLRKSNGGSVVKRRPYKEPISIQGLTGDGFELEVELESKAASGWVYKPQDLATCGFRANPATDSDAKAATLPT
jgi:hypothetical protein